MIQPTRFVVLSSTGLFWTGSGWSADMWEARTFTEPPDAYADCYLAVTALCRLGTPCNVACIPPRLKRPAPQVVAAESQRPGHGPA